MTPAEGRRAGITDESHDLVWPRFETTLLATSREIRRVYDLALRPVELNLTEASVLALVDERGPLTQTEIGKRFAMGRAAAGKVIDRLEGRRLVRRDADADDRRVWLVETTSKGTQVVAAVNDIDSAVRTQLRDGITKEERTHLTSVLVRLRRNLTTAAEDYGLDSR